jgi:hypothetical protein
VVNPDGVEVTAGLSLIGAGGETLGRTGIVIGPNSKRAMLLSELFAPAVLDRTRAVLVTGSVPLHSILAEGVSSPDMAILTPRPTTLEHGIPGTIPELVDVEPASVVPGSILRFRAENIDESTVLRFGNVDLPVRQLAPGIPILGVVVPPTEPGYLDVRLVRSDRFESSPVRVLVGPVGPGNVREIVGRAHFEKVPATVAGLDLGARYATPIAGARVEVFNLSTGAVFASGTTTRDGGFAVPAPEASGYGLRVLSSTPGRNLVVADNTANGTVYSIGTVLDSSGQPGVLVASDDAGVAGAFNILRVIGEGNAFVSQLDPDLAPPPLAVYWSRSNNQSTIGGTFFDATSRTAYVLGDRERDSDEFDDAVILHEYAHLLAEVFSRDDSAGGPHVRGDVLDPRVAWSEGWANFFSGLVRGDSVYIDTFGESGAVVFDLEENLSPGDTGGYWSEFAIHSLLWDLADGSDDAEADGVQLDLMTLWRAFEAVRGGDFVYLPTYLDRLVQISPDDESLVEDLARARSIDYEASDDPSVSNPFPRLVSALISVTGVVDS